MAFSKKVLELDLEAKAAQLSTALKEAVVEKLKRRGLVVAVSMSLSSSS